MDHPLLVKPIFQRILSLNQRILNTQKKPPYKKPKKKNYSSLMTKNATQIKLTKPIKYRKLTNMEDISTNYNENTNNKIKFNIPYLLPVDKDTDTDSEFLNIKLGECDSVIGKENKKKYNNDDSCEIYDFTNKTHVDFVMNNLSILSGSFSYNENQTNFFMELNENEVSGENKIENKIRMFNTKKSFHV